MMCRKSGAFPLLVCLLALSAAPARATLQCTLTAVPLQINSEGLAEPSGDVLLRCYGGAPFAVVSGTLQISLGRRIANVIDLSYGSFGGLSMQQEIASGVFATMAVTPRLVDNSIAFDGFSIGLNAQGWFGVKISGIRTEAIGATMAALQFTGNEQLFVSTPVVTIAYSQPGLKSTTLAALATGPGPMAPTYLDFSNMVASQAPVATVRVTEGHATAFTPWKMSPYVTNGTRLLVQLTGIPAGSRVFAPEAIAGSSALQMTTSGSMGGGPTPGLYNPVGSSSLLLVRVRDAQPDGAKGTGNWVLGPGPQTLFNVADLPVSGATAYAVYEVMDANPSLLENAQIPIWLFTPLDRPSTPSVVRSTVRLAPISDSPGSVSGAAIPRFRSSASVAGDCDALNDCTASYWPRLTATPVREPAFSAPSGGDAQSGHVLLRNEGIGLLEWQATILYRSATGWLTTFAERGFNNSTFRYDVNPKNLAPGHYEADIVFEQSGAPTGVNARFVIPVKLDVTAALPPPLPLPTIKHVVAPESRIFSPAAPGAIVLIEGTNFLDVSTVTIAGQNAQVLGISPTEITAIVPEGLAKGWYPVYVINLDRFSQAWNMEVIPVAPAQLYALNSDDGRNSETLPVEAGSTIQIFVTGIRQAMVPLPVKIHDRWLDAMPEATAMPGVDVVRFTVPDDFPTMSTAVLVCGRAPGDDGMCSYPRDVWIKEKPPAPPAQ